MATPEPIHQHGIEARQTSAGEVRINRVEVSPSPVAPNGQVSINVTLAETAEFLGPNDPDLCSPGWLSSSGIRATVVLRPSWTSITEKTKCVPMYNLLFGEREYSFQLPAPPVTPGQNTGAGQVDVQVSLPGSGKQSEWITVNVPVDPTGEDNPGSGSTDVVHNDGSVSDDKTKQWGILDGLFGGDGGGIVLLVFLLILLVIVMNASD